MATEKKPKKKAKKKKKASRLPMKKTAPPLAKSRPSVLEPPPMTAEEVAAASIEPAHDHCGPRAPEVPVLPEEVAASLSPQELEDVRAAGLPVVQVEFDPATGTEEILGVECPAWGKKPGHRREGV